MPVAAVRRSSVNSNAPAGLCQGNAEYLLLTVIARSRHIVFHELFGRILDQKSAENALYFVALTVPFFAILTKRRLKRGVFKGVVDLQAAINRFIAKHNQQPKPFTWTADPDKIIAAASRGHQRLDSMHQCGRPFSHIARPDPLCSRDSARPCARCAGRGPVRQSARGGAVQ